MQEVYQTKLPPFVLLAIDQTESLEAVTDFIEYNDYSFPVLLDTDYAVSLEYRVLGAPMTFFIDKDGIIRGKRIGAFSGTAEIEDYLDTIMP